MAVFNPLTGITYPTRQNWEIPEPAEAPIFDIKFEMPTREEIKRQYEMAKRLEKMNIANNSTTLKLILENW